MDPDDALDRLGVGALERRRGVGERRLEAHDAVDVVPALCDAPEGLGIGAREPVGAPEVVLALDRLDDVVGAILLSGPRERYDDDRIVNDLLPALRDAANVVEVKYAYE